MITCLSVKELALFLQMLSVEPVMLDNGNALMFQGSDANVIHVWQRTEEVDANGDPIWCFNENPGEAT